jgi:hypothetical protein
MTTAEKLREKVNQLKLKKTEDVNHTELTKICLEQNAEEIAEESKSECMRLHSVNEASVELPILPPKPRADSSTHIHMPLRYRGIMPLKKLCIIGFKVLDERKDRDNIDNLIIDESSLRRLMQLYSIIMYGKPIQGYTEGEH